MPLDHELGSDATLPESLDLNSAKPIVGVVISHPHADHYGLASDAHPSIPVYIGSEAHKLLRAAEKYAAKRRGEGER